MKERVHAVFDTGAIRAYVAGSVVTGEVLIIAANTSARVAVPSTCLLEVYRDIEPDGRRFLMLLRNHEAVVVFRPGDMNTPGFDDYGAIGVMGRNAGRLGAGHAAAVGLHHGAQIVTSRPDQIHDALPGWPVIKL